MHNAFFIIIAFLSIISLFVSSVSLMDGATFDRYIAVVTTAIIFTLSTVALFV